MMGRFNVSKKQSVGGNWGAMYIELHPYESSLSVNLHIFCSDFHFAHGVLTIWFLRCLDV